MKVSELKYPTDLKKGSKRNRAVQSKDDVAPSIRVAVPYNVLGDYNKKWVLTLNMPLSTCIAMHVESFLQVPKAGIVRPYTPNYLTGDYRVVNVYLKHELKEKLRSYCHAFSGIRFVPMSHVIREIIIHHAAFPAGDFVFR